MPEQIGLIANLDLCMGCFACEVACKQEHDLSEAEKGIAVVTLGPYEIDGELAMDFLPVASGACDLCSGRRAAGKRPFCAEVCPTKALTLQKADEILKLLRRKDRVHVCKTQIVNED
jgi:anaerobic dimethyl sulfoxide reductase subunit B (iron-sulfur subunit)